MNYKFKKKTTTGQANLVLSFFYDCNKLIDPLNKVCLLSDQQIKCEQSPGAHVFELRHHHSSQKLALISPLQSVYYATAV